MDMWLRDQGTKEAELLARGKIRSSAITDFRPTVSLLPGGFSLLSGGLQMLGAKQEENPWLRLPGYAAGGTEAVGGMLYIAGAKLLNPQMLSLGGEIMSTAGAAGTGVGVATVTRDAFKVETEVSKVLICESQKKTYPSWFMPLFNAVRIGMAFSGM